MSPNFDLLEKYKSAQIQGNIYFGSLVQLQASVGK